jgi:hypothetical protein
MFRVAGWVPRRPLAREDRIPCFLSSQPCRKNKLLEAVPKLQFLARQALPVQQLIKTAVLQPEGRKTARAGYKITDFVTGSLAKPSKAIRYRGFNKTIIPELPKLSVLVSAEYAAC